ncbi:ATP binding microtubule motor family protein [Forsythia ovata]|uniref:Kinesin-like protein n=1 Tax=Forsythia ovata TaxID=205694 RepID=A0ABD1QRG2_9LAMI
MPVSTRSQIFSRQAHNGPTHEPRTKDQQEKSHMALRNPHHGLKEKMKALTLLYEQQKQASAAIKEPRFSSHPSVDLFSSGKTDEKWTKESNPTISHVMREIKLNNSTDKRTYVMPLRPMAEDLKENVVVACGGGDRNVGLLSPIKANMSSKVARKLSMVSEPCGSKNVDVEESETTEVKSTMANGRILVFGRLRPVAKKEREAGSKCCVRIVNKRDIYLTEFANENDYLRLKRLRGRHFTFDASFPDSTTQQEVYSKTTAGLVEAVLQGRNGSVFCYGATGAGKTFTMLGTMDNPGVMVLAIKDLFSKIRLRSFEGNHTVHLSYLEVYNETVRDLLAPGRPLVLREDKQGIVAAGLTQYRAYSTDEVMALLQQGNLNRTTEPTRANETSSRSHAILQVVVEYQVKGASGNVVNRVGKLSLIDLAGSERAIATDQRTLRSLEGANINRSLLALSSCINALVEGKKHIPYRNSKLTQLLKDSLGGACNTVMIANISPSSLSFGETQNTLHWADRAKEIRTKACDVNEEMQIPDSETDQAKLLLELQKENRDLRMQLARQQQKLLTIQAQSIAATSSPTPTSASQPNEKQKPRPSLSVGNCFSPVSKTKAANQTVELMKTIRSLEAEIQRMKKDHALQIKQKDNFIHELSLRGAELAETRGKGVKRNNSKAKEPPEGNLRTPTHRFLSPAPTAKKRRFWDITTANSPSVATLTGRKTRSHFTTEPVAAPSMLLQPGFACHRPETVKR